MLISERELGTQNAERATVALKQREIFTITFILFLPSSFKGLTVLKEKLQGNGHSRDGGSRPRGCDKGGHSLWRGLHRVGGGGGARVSAEPVREAAVAARRGAAGGRTRVRVRGGPSGPGRGEAASGIAGTWRVDPSRVTVRDTLYAG